jgi:hypothetical protein
MASKLKLRDGAVAIVDDADLAAVLGYRWRRDAKGYVVASVSRKGRRECLRLHRLLAGLAVGDPRVVDHRDGDLLNNRRANLRVCTDTENKRNRRRHANNRSGFKGVSWAARENKWRAEIRVDGKLIFLGYHASPVVAHGAYREAAVKHFGEFARFE